MLKIGVIGLLLLVTLTAGFFYAGVWPPVDKETFSKKKNEVQGLINLKHGVFFEKMLLFFDRYVMIYILYRWDVTFVFLLFTFSICVIIPLVFGV